MLSNREQILSIETRSFGTCAKGTSRLCTAHSSPISYFVCWLIDPYRLFPSTEYKWQHLLSSRPWRYVYAEKSTSLPSSDCLGLTALPPTSIDLNALENHTFNFRVVALFQVIDFFCVAFQLQNLSMTVNALAAAGDVLIAIAMVILLHTSRTGFRKCVCSRILSDPGR